MDSFPVSDIKKNELQIKMARAGLYEKDLDEQFIRGSGAGGQKINKSSSTVLLRHQPSGLEVRCRQTRSQALNRFLARRLLLDKFIEKIRGEESEKRKKIEKIRRQKRKRSKRAREKMLADKRHRGEIKRLRQVRVDE